MSIVVVLVLSLFAPSSHASTEKSCAYLLSAEDGREINPYWIKAVEPLRLARSEMRQIGDIQEVLQRIFNLATANEILSLRDPFFTQQLHALHEFALDLKMRLQKYELLLPTRGLMDDRTLEVESDLERIETLLAHDRLDRIADKLRPVVERLSQRMGRKIPLDETYIRGWIQAAKDNFALRRAQEKVQIPLALAYMEKAAPVIDLLVQALDSPASAEASYQEVLAYSLALARIDEKFQVLTTLDRKLTELGRPVSEFDLAFNGEVDFLSQVQIFLEHPSAEGRIDRQKLDGLSELMSQATRALRRGQIFMPLAAKWNPRVELALAFLPVEFWRLPVDKADDRQTERLESGGRIFLHDLLRSERMYDSDEIHVVSSSEVLPKLDKSLKVWKSLWAAAEKTRERNKALFLLFLLRHHELLFSRHEVLDWSNSGQVLKLVMEKVVVDWDGHRDLFTRNFKLRPALAHLAEYMREQFNFSGEVGVSMVNACDEFATALRPQVRDVHTVGLHELAVEALQNKRQPFHQFIQLLKDNELLDQRQHE
jgi:tetrahydromethanopterin S-methyltransferase subunit G